MHQKLLTEGGRLLAFFQTLTEADWQTIVYPGEPSWTVRHILAHLVASERDLAALFEHIRQGHPGVPPNFSIDERNAQHQAEAAHLTPAELLEAFWTVRANTVAWVQTLTEHDLERTGRHPFLGQTALRKMIQLLSVHAHLHWRDIKHALHKA